MCNTECIRFVELAVESKDVKGKDVLEVGAYDVNGSARPYLENLGPRSYVGIDLQEGPRVDLILDAEHLVERFGEETFDVVVSTEMLEHVADWRRIITNMKRVVRPGGLIVITTRSRGFGFHDFPHDYWRYEPEDMRVIFADCFIEKLARDPLSPGVYVSARRPAVRSFEPLDLSGYALFSMHDDRRVLELGDGAAETPDPVDLSPQLARERQLLDEVDRVRAELAAVRATRTFRYTALPRHVYGRIRDWRRRTTAP